MQPGSWPTQCEVCRRWGPRRVCQPCTARHAAEVPRCARCALRLGADAPACGRCLADPPPFTRTVCVADYDFPWDRLIADFKFHAAVELGAALAALLSAAVQARGEPWPELLLPVPSAASRLAQRGYNPAAELARRVARSLQRPLADDLLLRVTDTAHQSGLSRAERAANLRAAFMVDPAGTPRLAGRHVALVDDVLTTGATAAEATRALLRGGAARVDLWVFARTPES